MSTPCDENNKVQGNVVISKISEEKISPILKPGFNVNTARLKLRISFGYRKDF
jgi:hypothetical protein